MLSVDEKAHELIWKETHTFTHFGGGGFLDIFFSLVKDGTRFTSECALRSLSDIKILGIWDLFALFSGFLQILF